MFLKLLPIMVLASIVAVVMLVRDFMKNTRPHPTASHAVPAQVVKRDLLKDSERVEQMTGFESCNGFAVVFTDQARYQVGSTCPDGYVLAADFSTVRVRRWDARILTIHVFQGALPTPVPMPSPEPTAVADSALAMGSTK